MKPEMGARVEVRGVVQGVGFRPFVFSLARRHDLKGWVRNTSAGVEMELDGQRSDLDLFLQDLKVELPPLARLDELKVEYRDSNGFSSFEILPSQRLRDGFQLVSPDVCVCRECLLELRDPTDRRHRYPFINCTNCGPRYTIITDLPYDRPNTTMAPFPLCAECAAEYQDPEDRRFHAEPVACPACGPQLWLEANGIRHAESDLALQLARDWLKQGQLLAVKGLGGYHLACDAANHEAVLELRRRKARPAKPLALMLPDVQTVREYCVLSEAEERQLLSPERPILLLHRRRNPTANKLAPISEAVAPGQQTLGVMLPYTPLHALLMEPTGEAPRALVMTSGNPRSSPLMIDDQAARLELADLADGFLAHPRKIHRRCDDSVARIHRDEIYPIRRARGYAPAPIRMPFQAPPLLAGGAELKNTFCLVRDGLAFLSPHIGDLSNFATLQAYEATIAEYETLFRVTPIALGYDLHPDYLASQYIQQRARAQGLPAFGIQHHHAHIAACLADNQHPGTRPVIGISFDGAGYGPDGAVWGGEFLLADYDGYQRVMHLKYVPMPGGDSATRQIWRMALAWLEASGLAWEDHLPPVRSLDEDTLILVEKQISAGINTPLTSSVGRLYDAVAALAGLRQEVSYEAQAAIELEACTDPHEEGAYPFVLAADHIDPAPMLHNLLSDLAAGARAGVLFARFQNGLARAVVSACRSLRRRYGLDQVALSGGVWQNMYLLETTGRQLEDAGFQVLIHRQVPANDGGLALGQAAITVRAAQKMNDPALARNPQPAVMASPAKQSENSNI